MKKQILIITVIIVIFGICILIYKKNDVITHTSSGIPLVVCTTGIIADTVQVIAGEYVHVHCLMGPGIDPHSYHATAKDVQLLMSADVIIYNGLHLEGKMAELLHNMSASTTVLAIGDHINKTDLIKVDNDIFDPHIWHDVLLWCHAVRSIESALQTCCSENKDIIHKNTADYIKKLETLHDEIKVQIEQIPVSQRILITAHDAFSYFGRAYGFAVIGLQGISTDVHVGIKDVVSLAQYIILHKVPVIFMESCVPRRTLESVVQAVHAAGHQVMLCDELFADALGPQKSGADTYIGMIQHNVKTIVDALQNK